MKQDLSEFFQRGLEASATWTREKSGEVLHALATACPGARVDWEPGDEEWGRVLDSDGRVAGLVCARIPVGLARADVPESGLSSAVTWLRFESIDQHDYRISPHILEKVFGRPVSRNIRYHAMSLNDLWWATVS